MMIMSKTPKLPKVAMKKLTQKQQIFVKEYVTNGFNATQAAISAGYSKKNADVIGWENLGKVGILEVISKYKDEIALKYDIKIPQLLDYAFKLIDSCIGDDGEITNRQYYLKGIELLTQLTGNTKPETEVKIESEREIKITITKPNGD